MPLPKAGEAAVGAAEPLLTQGPASPISGPLDSNSMAGPSTAQPASVPWEDFRALIPPQAQAEGQDDQEHRGAVRPSASSDTHQTLGHHFLLSSW